MLVRALEEARARHARGAEWLLLLDLDGTLADFKVDPKKVDLHPGVRETLRRLTLRARTKVVVVTGRRAQEAHRIVGISAVDVVGMHGRELFARGRLRTQRAPLRARRALDALLRTARALAARVPGAIVEDKRPGGVVLHVRGAAPAAGKAIEAEFVKAIRRARGDGIEWMTGKAMAEGRVGGIDKGSACEALAREAIARARTRPAPLPVILFAGDDVTDEHAHESLRKFRAITIVVAKRPRGSAARFRVTGISGMKAALDRLGRPGPSR